MNIICLKWGNKFDHNHVNRLYKMVKKNFKKDFTFICYTENSLHINNEIEIKPLPLEYDLENWWWKLTLFKNPVKCKTIYFDLDIVIQNDISHLDQYCEKNKICTIKTYWKPHLFDKKPEPQSQYDHTLNSSVMLWNGSCVWAWKEFEKNLDYYMLKYKGIDSYLYIHHYNKLTWLPKGEVYSRLYGYDEKNFWNPYNPNDKVKYFYNKKFNICIFNGWKRKRLWDDPKEDYILDDNGYLGYEKYWNN